MTWHPSELDPEVRTAHSLDGSCVTRSFNRRGFALSISSPDGSTYATLEPADALALAADIQREYGGKE